MGILQAPKWELIYFPETGENFAPEDALTDLCSAAEQNNILQKLRVIRALENWHWPRWVKQVQNIYQITSGDFRVYFEIDGHTIVVTHLCRKVGQKARKEDISRAKENFKLYKSRKDE